MLFRSEWSGLAPAEQRSGEVARFTPLVRTGGFTCAFGDIDGDGVTDCVFRMDNGINERSVDPGVPVELVPYDAAGKMTDAAKAGAWDIAFLGIDAARAMEIDFTAAYIELEGTYMVPAGSMLRRIDDVDRSGVRISVTAGSAYDLFLSRALKQASIVRAPSTPASFTLLQTQRLDAVAGVRTALVAAAKDLPGSTVLSGHFMTIPQAMGVPKGRTAAARYVREFVESVKASGFVATALRRHNLTADDAIVAPPATAGRE